MLIGSEFTAGTGEPDAIVNPRTSEDDISAILDTMA